MNKQKTSIYSQMEVYESWKKGIKDGFNPDDTLTWIWGVPSGDDAEEKAYQEGIKVGQRLLEDKEKLLAMADESPNKLKFWSNKAMEYNQFISSCSLQDQGEEAEILIPMQDFCEKQVQHYS